MTDATAERDAIALFEQSLAIAEPDRGAWIAERTEGRPALRARVEGMRDADRRAALHTGAATAMLDDEQIPERIGAYRVVERIGRGGMGSVYRAERMTGDFAHVAAIKVIKPGLLSEALVERFQRERQTLAQLTHPHIAQLFDGGEAADGSPYIVMEYVDGLPLLEFAAERELSREARLSLFLDICDAVGFAHRNLVVHRDLTPTNVLVTREGRAKLIDFGIAKPASEPDEAHAGSPSFGSLSLTPGFAAPERMTSANVSTTADIYSLGKVLERLVPPGPKDGELRAIIACATAPDPNGRYPTAEALRSDIAAWRTGYPVRAMGAGRRYRFRKYVARHRPAVIGGTMAVSMLVAALIVAIVANSRTERARAEAERRFEQTRAIAKVMIFDVYDEVAKTAGSTKAREMLATVGLQYLDALAADIDAPLDVRIEVGRGYRRLANVVGGNGAGNLGKLADANTLLAKGEAILKPLHERYPDNREVTLAYADLLLEQAATNLYNNNDADLAIRQCALIQKMLAPFAASSAEAARLYGSAIQGEADGHGWNDDYAGAEPIYRRGERFLASLPAALANDAGVLSTRSAILRLFGEALHHLGRDPEARESLRKAIAINERLVAASPDDPRMIRKLAVSQWYYADLLRTAGMDVEARAAITAAVASARRMIARDPNDAGALSTFALTGEVESMILADAGDWKASYARGDEVIAAHTRLVALSGRTAGARRSMASSLLVIGSNHYNGGDYAGACRIWRDTDALWRGIDAEGHLSSFDRNGQVKRLRGFLRSSCEGGPPRKGAGNAI